MNNIEKNTSLIFEKFVNQTGYEIKQEAILQRALTDKITSETINQKVTYTFEIKSYSYGCETQVLKTIKLTFRE